jgi:hypothetical protein
MKLGRKFQTACEILRSEGFRALARHTAAKLWHSVHKTEGDGATVWEVRKKTVDATFDSDHGVDTGGTTHLNDFNIAGPHRRFGTCHIASDPDEFADAVASLDIEHRDFTFIDLGSGKGRALILGLSYPFRRILGVEFALELHHAAETNLISLAATGTDTCRIELLHADVTKFDFPLEPLVVFLYNPFEGVVMRKVVERVRQTHAENPRPIFILYVKPVLEKVWIEGGFSLLKRGGTFSLLAPKNPGFRDQKR